MQRLERLESVAVIFEFQGLGFTIAIRGHTLVPLVQAFQVESFNFTLVSFRNSESEWNHNELKADYSLNILKVSKP